MIKKLEINHVNLSYKDFSALKDIHLTLESGKIYGLIGRNGAGKTSLLSLLAAYQKASSGEITIDGATIFENEQAMSTVSFIHQVDYKDEYDTIPQFFELAKRYRPTFDLQYAQKLTKLFQLPMDKPLKKLSTGMQSAFNVTMGLANQTPVTIFDEAYQGMDAPTREIFYNEILEEQARNPRLFILSTHLVSEMDYLFDHVLVIDKGALIVDEAIDTLLEKGFSVTGATSAVDQVIDGLQIVSEQQLGGTKSVMVYGQLSKEKAAEIERSGLEIGNVSLHDLFIQLTKEDQPNV